MKPFKTNSDSWTGRDPSRAAIGGLSAKFQLRAGMFALVAGGAAGMAAAYQLFGDGGLLPAFSILASAAVLIATGANFVREGSSRKMREARADTSHAR